MKFYTDKQLIIPRKKKNVIHLPLLFLFLCLLLLIAWPICAHWEVVVQQSASPCRPVMYESDLWLGGNGKHR